MHQLAAQIRQRARQMGFDLVGIAPAAPSKYRQYFRDWLDSGQAGAMEYLHRRFDERTDPAVYLPGARSAICVAMNYHVPLSTSALQGEGGGEGRNIGTTESRSGESTSVESQRFDPHPDPLPARERGKIARYALGDDYHELMKPRLHALADWIRQNAPAAQTRCAVDTAPVMEKELAASAGIGWMGKHTCVINPQIGSWLLLGEIITTLELPADEPAVDRCGRCRRCIDACPTQAITAPYQLDARRCISYLTIELREQIPIEFHHQMGEWLFGCDVCQDVCPWNSKAPAVVDEALRPRFADGRLDLRELLNWRDEDYRERLGGSAMKRVKLPVLQRNAGIVLKNVVAEAITPLGQSTSMARG